MSANEVDIALIREVIKGNEEAFNQLYDQYYRLVYYIAFELCHNDADAKDILQETFIQIRQSISSLQDPANFKAWLNRIVINKCKNLFRAKRNVDLDQEDVWYQHHVTEDRFYMLPEDNMHMKNDQELVHELMNQLSDVQREVLIMRYFEHMTMQEMAEALEVPVGTVKTRLLYGKSRLKELILAYEEENDVKIDFKVDSFGLVALFVYLYHYTDFPMPVYIPKIKKKKHISDKFLNGIMASLAAVCLCSGVMAYQAYNEQSKSEDQTIQVQDRDKLKQYYFTLMDWACCKDDMLVKSKSDFEQIMPVYKALKDSHSAYAERLIKDQWFHDFEAIYEQF